MCVHRSSIEMISIVPCHTEVEEQLGRLVPTPGCALGHYDGAKASTLRVCDHRVHASSSVYCRIYRIRCTKCGLAAARHWARKLPRSSRTTRSATAGRIASVTLHIQPCDYSCMCRCDVTFTPCTHIYITILWSMYMYMHTCTFMYLSLIHI